MPITQTADVSPVPTLTPEHATVVKKDSSVLWILGAGLIGFALKLIIASKTIGTNDVITFYDFAKSLQQHGLQWTYQDNISFNHPPLIAYYLQAIYRLDHTAFFHDRGLTFPFLIRLPGIVADLVTLFALLWLGRRDERFRIPSWALIVFALSPVSLMVAGFHGNTDPVMVMFLVLAAVFTARKQPALSGLVLACSCQIKIVPLVLLPVFFFFWNARARTLSFSVPFLVTSACLWIQPLTQFPLSFLQNVLSYGSYWGIWGLTYWLRLTNLPQFGIVSFHDLPLSETLVVTILKIFIISAVLIIAWRRRKVDERAFFDSIAIAWIVFFIFAPGVCVQYMTWLAPFVLMLSRPFYVWLVAASSLFVFFFYDVTAGGLPWYVAISTNRLNRIWTPWTIWPWIVLILGLARLWRDAVAKNPKLRLISLNDAEQ